jgi:signal transduction histidine kinase
MNSIVALLWTAPRHWRYASIAVLLVLTYVLGYVALLAPPTGTGVAAWWPAAGVAVLALCASKRRERWLVAALVGLVTVASTLSGGRPLPVSLGFGLANALEALVVVGVVGTAHDPARLDTVRDVMKFGLGVICGAVVLGLVAGATVAVAGTGSFGTALLTVIPSHAFAVFVIVPLALVRRRRINQARRIELFVQVGAMAVVLIVAYAPGQSVPLSFLLLPLLTWAAFRFGIRVVSWELFGTAVIASAFAVLGVGYFTTGQESTATSGSLVQIFLLTYAGSVLLLAAELAQRDDLLGREREVVHALQDLNRQKDDFVSSVSHELRTPITSILGYAEELEDTDLDADQARFTRVIVRNSHRLAQLVEDLLDLSRMSTRSAEHEVAFVDLRELVTDCVEELTPLAHGSGVFLTAEFGSGSLTLHSSAADLRRMLTNLVSNAVKFTPKDGQVWVGCSGDADGGGVLVTVSDNGIGIPPAEIERVFDRFYRSASAESLPGTGLGLPLTKGLVDRLGGSIDLQSDGHSGTHATVALPRRMPVGADPVDPTDSRVGTTRM